MRRLLAAAALAAALIPAAPSGAAAPPRCGHEDSPSWTWSRCGNHKRGVSVGGFRFTVGPCRFARLYRAGVLDPAPLRGDTWALVNGCPKEN